MQAGTGANTRDFQLGIDGFTFHDLYKPAKLAELDAKFRAQLKARDGALSARFEEYRGGAAFSPVDESNLIVAVAAHLGNFVGELFKVQAQREKLFARAADERALGRVRAFVMRRCARLKKDEKAEALSTTRGILPVHLGGAAADLDVILAVAKKHNLPVIEDACQSHLAEWKKQKVGTLGDLGCFSLQASKNLNSGEGGAVVSNNERLLEICRSFHNQGRAAANSNMTYARNGDNRRMTEFQGAILLAQLTRLEEQATRREQNAEYLTRQLREIPGLKPARQYEGCTRNAYHLYMFRYDAPQFSGLARDRFLAALRAEGVPCAGGYEPLNKEQFLKNALSSRAYRYIYSDKALNDLAARNRHCPENDQLCQEAVWLTQNMLLGTRQDMDQIAAAIRKIQQQAALLARS